MATLVERSVDRVLSLNIPVYKGMPREVLRALVGRAFVKVGEDLKTGTPSVYPEYLRNLGLQRAAHGTPIREMIYGLNQGFDVVSETFKEVFPDDLEARLWWEERKHQISHAGALALTDAYYTAREAIIAEQHAQILRLSAPIVPLYSGVLLLPIVGALSQERSALILESLLESIARQRTEVVIIDVTGMHAECDDVAGQIARAARAAALLGARVIVVGISASVAVIFARGGVDLGGVTVLGDLKSGVERALQLKGRAITEIDPRRH